MAWVEQLPGGKWRGCWRDTAGKKHYTRQPEYPLHPYSRKSDARAAAQEAEARARREAAVTTGTLPASITWGQWWDLIRPARPTSDTWQAEHYVVQRYVRPQWGDVPLARITHRAVQDWVDDLAPTRAPAYTRRIYALLQMSMNRAVDKGVLSASPCVRIKLPPLRRRPKVYVDDQYLDAIRQANSAGRMYLRDPGHQDLLLVGLETGLRPGELCGMHADQVDLVGGWVDVTNVYVRSRKAIRGHPKDKDARRVPLTARALEILSRCLADRPVTGGCGIPHLDGKPCGSALTFLNKRGGLITQVALYEAMQWAAKRAGVSKSSPYAARRGFATWAAEGGLDPFALAAIMGHADVRQTTEYVQQTPAARDRLRAARGEPPTMRLVTDPGAPGAALRGSDGAESSRQATESDDIQAG